MRVIWRAFCVLTLVLFSFSANVQGQFDIVAEIQRAASPPEIDGIGDGIWLNATAHNTTDDPNAIGDGTIGEFWTCCGEPPEDEFDLDVTWKALWDDDNLYVLIEVTDDELINDVACNWNDDSVEVYIDAQDLNVPEYNPTNVPGEPAYQFTSIAGNDIDAVCANVLYENNSFSHGINSYDGDDGLTQYPQGSDISANVTSDQADIGDLTYSFEVAFPWEALEETPQNILANGEMGFGIAVNDADFVPGTRDTQIMWATENGDLWHISEVFPSVALSTETVDAGGEITPELQPGDADQNLTFDQLDIVQVSIANKYLSGTGASWGEGDWDGAPGGEQGAPPAGNGFFDQLDIIAALSAGKYLTGPYAVETGGVVGDEQTSLVYDAGTGELSVDAPASTELTSIFVTSAGNSFIGDKPDVLDGPFDSFGPDNIFKSTIGSSFGDITFGMVLPAGLSEADVAADLTASGSLDGGGGLGDVDLVYIPEPSTVTLLALGLLIGLARARRRS